MEFILGPIVLQCVFGPWIKKMTYPMGGARDSPKPLEPTALVDGWGSCTCLNLMRLLWRLHVLSWSKEFDIPVLLPESIHALFVPYVSNVGDRSQPSNREIVEIYCTSVGLTTPDEHQFQLNVPIMAQWALSNATISAQGDKCTDELRFSERRVWG